MPDLGVSDVELDTYDLERFVGRQALKILILEKRLAVLHELANEGHEETQSKEQEESS